MSVNEIRDFPVQGLRNFIITESGVVEVQQIPINILRIKVVGSGSTLIYIWDSQGRKTIQIDVNGLTTNQITTFRPGYDPAGSEFIYHGTMNNQFANNQLIAPFWNHEFLASVPTKKNNEWRTLLRASTIDQGDVKASNYAPFSNSTVMDQFLTYYQTLNYTAAAGDVNYNAGELSVTGFPLRGGSVQLYSDDRQDQLQLFGGASRSNSRTNSLFNDPLQNFYGASGTKTIFPNVSVRSSLVYLDQSDAVSNFSNTTYKNDYVADVGIQARPFTDKFNFETEYAKSSDDHSIRGLLEYIPFWGRIMVSQKRVGKDYVNPASFYLQRNFNETNFITDVKPTKKMGFTLNYQLTQLKADASTGAEKTTVNRAQLTNLYQADEETSYLTGFSVNRSESLSSPQNTERLDVTYQRFFIKSRDQLYAQLFGQHSENHFLANTTERYGSGTDVRYTKNFSKKWQGYFQNTLQVNRVNNNFSNFGTPPKYFETIATIGPTVNFVDTKKTFSGGFYETFTFRDAFSQFSHLVQPFATAYYNLSQALSLGARLNFNLDLTNDNSYVSAVGELIYRFGSRVPDTLFSTFIASAQITGMVFVDENEDGEYQSNEKLITNYTVALNDHEPEVIKTERFVLKTDSGPNKIYIQLPKEYQGYQFATSNPTFLDLFPRETRSLNFAISQRIPLRGKVIVQDEIDKAVTDKNRGLEGVKIEITGETFNDVVETTAAGNFNGFVAKPGKYFAKIRTLELPKGYKYSGPSKIEFTVEEGKIATIPPFVIQAKRFIVGRAFIDVNGNNIFDDNDQPLNKVKIKIGDITIPSDEDGTFSTTSIPAGSYQIQIEPKMIKDHHLIMLTDRILVPLAGTVEMSVPYQK